MICIVKTSFTYFESVLQLQYNSVIFTAGLLMQKALICISVIVFLILGMGCYTEM